MLLGGLLGLLLPGLSLLRGAPKFGVRSTFTARLRDTGFEDDDLRAMAETMAPGASMVVAIVQYHLADEFVRMLAERNAEVVSAGLSEAGAVLLARFQNRITREGGNDVSADWDTPRQEQ